MTNFDIKVVSDTVCPWCYVGKKRLENGIAMYKAAHPDSSDTFTISWFPFYLNPNAPRKGINKKEMYNQKFGEQQATIIQQRLVEIGKVEGINFSFGGKTGNTRDSHRLIQLGKTKNPELGTRIIEKLFQAYFENEQDITSHEVLQAAGVRAGLDADEVKQWLESDKGGAQVDEEVARAQSAFISGVPNFTLQGKHQIRGAQDPSTFVRILERIKAEEK